MHSGEIMLDGDTVENRNPALLDALSKSRGPTAILSNTSSRAGREAERIKRAAAVAAARRAVGGAFDVLIIFVAFSYLIRFQHVFLETAAHLNILARPPLHYFRIDVLRVFDALQES